eukprot:gene5731-215_t
MSGVRRSPRLASLKKPAAIKENSVHLYTIPKKQTRQEKEIEKKKVERASRKNRGLRRADTVFEYAGHPETRENINNPFNKLMGKVVEVFLGKEFGWKRGRVIEFHAFDGLHVIEFEDKMKRLFNLGKKRYRIISSGEDSETQMKKPKLKRDPTVVENEDDKDEELDDEDQGIDATSTATDDEETAPKSKITFVGKPVIDPFSGVTCAHVLEEDGIIYEASLASINISTNTDKYYLIQVAEADDKSTYWCINHWGRTGTRGQFSTTVGTKEEVIEAFKNKFFEKTGIKFEDRNSASFVPGMYKYKQKDYSAPTQGRVMWQYYVDDFVDGKATGWYNYVETASNTVEGVYSEWKFNDWLDVRCVQSGYFQYRVDFKTMTQTNLRTGKCRKIRRVDESGAVTTSPASS